jgi:hypothetical protein
LILFICALLLLIPSTPSLRLHPLLLHPQRRPQLGPSHGVRSTLPFSSHVLPVHARSSLTALPLPSSHGRVRLDLLRARHGCAVTFPVPVVASSGDPLPHGAPFLARRRCSFSSSPWRPRPQRRARPQRPARTAPPPPPLSARIRHRVLLPGGRARPVRLLSSTMAAEISLSLVPCVLTLACVEPLLSSWRSSSPLRAPLL